MSAAPECIILSIRGTVAPLSPSISLIRYLRTFGTSTWPSRLLGKVAGIDPMNGDTALKAAPSFLACPNIPLSLLSPHTVTVQSHTEIDPTLEVRAGGGGKGVVSNRF